MTLTEFLRARVAEDEAVAESLRRGGYDPWGWQPHGWRVEQTVSPGRRVALTPARMLAECEAKRRIVEGHPSTDPINHEGDRYCRRCLASGYDTGYPDEWVQAFYPCPTLRLLALSYADHPDYLQEWKP